MKRSYPMHCLFRSNVVDVRMLSLISYIKNIKRIFGNKIFYRKLKINSMSIRTGNDEYIMTQKDHKYRYQKCDFHFSTPPPPLVELSYLTRYTIRDAKNILQI